jgi:hypothetical protein
MDTQILAEVLPLVAPLVLVQFGLMIAGLLDLQQRSSTRGPRWLWLVLILFVGLVGPTMYFLYGREST